MNELPLLFQRLGNFLDDLLGLLLFAGRGREVVAARAVFPFTIQTEGIGRDGSGSGRGRGRNSLQESR